MNEVGEQINYEEITKKCRVMNPYETIAQLKRMNIRKFICWGATNFIVDNKNNPKMLRFSVSGMKHKGYIFIFLNGMDLYDVYITKFDGTIVYKSDNIGLYFEDMTDWIDDRI